MFKRLVKTRFPLEIVQTEAIVAILKMWILSIRIAGKLFFKQIFFCLSILHYEEHVLGRNQPMPCWSSSLAGIGFGGRRDLSLGSRAGRP